MNRFKHMVLLLSSAGFILASGCIEETDTSLFEDGEPELVIEGVIENTDGPFYVKVSRSAQPDESFDFVPISVSSVRITTSEGVSELLKPIALGVYESRQISGFSGMHYRLDVEVDNFVYTASDTLPFAPVIDSILVEYKDEVPYVPGFYISIQSGIEVRKRNFYRLEIAVNDSTFNAYSDLIIYEDLNREDQPLVTIPYIFEKSDTVDITLHAISQDMYNYYNGLLKQTTNTYSNIQPPLLNPPSNILYEPLGYFQVSAHTSVRVVVE